MVRFRARARGLSSTEWQLRTLFPGIKRLWSLQHNFTHYAVDKQCLYLVGITPSTFPGNSFALSNDTPYFIEITLQKMV